MSSGDASGGVEVASLPRKGEISPRLDEGLRRLGNGGDVVTEKRMCVLEAARLDQGRELLAVIDLAERRGVVTQLSKQLEQRYNVRNWRSEMMELFDGMAASNRPVDFETFHQAVVAEYGADEAFSLMINQESLVLEYIFSQITGKSKALATAVMERMAQLQEARTVRLNEKTIEIETSLRRIYGGDSVIGEFLTRRGGTTDTPISLFVPISPLEYLIYQKRLASSKDNVLSLDTGDVRALTQHILGRSGLLGMQHGYGADRRVYRKLAGRWLTPVPNEDRLNPKTREIGIAMTTKGGEKTTLRNKRDEIVSGHMDLAAVQEATTLHALGLVGRDIEAETRMRGHSMGGQEMFWLAMYAQQGWRMSYEAFAPVVTNESGFLSLFGGEVASIEDIPGLINKLSAEVPRWLAAMTKNERVGEAVGTLVGKVATAKVGGTSLGELIASYLIDSGEACDPAEVREIIKIHVENLQDYWYTQAVYRALTQDAQLDGKMLATLYRFYGDKFAVVWVAAHDRILRSEQMRKILVDAGWRDKLRVLGSAGHYAQTAWSHAVQLPH